MLLSRFVFSCMVAILPAAAAFSQSPTCDETLWNHVYKPDRLDVKNKCVTVTGTLVDATKTEDIHQNDGVRHEEDGDTHGWLQLDPGQEQYLNDANKNFQGGNLVFEIVCKYAVKQADAKTACQDYESPVKLPPVGSHVAITGTWVQDKEHEQWLEIHPVTSITITK